MAEQFLSIEQAAERLHVHPVTIRRHLKSGLLRGKKQGKLWRVPESALGEDSQTPSAVSPLLRALALIQERDAGAGETATRRDGDAAFDGREMQTPAQKVSRLREMQAFFQSLPDHRAEAGLGPVVNDIRALAYEEDEAARP